MGGTENIFSNDDFHFKFGMKFDFHDMILKNEYLSNLLLMVIIGTGLVCFSCLYTCYSICVTCCCPKRIKVN